MANKKTINLTKREMEIMRVLWDTEAHMSASEILQEINENSGKDNKITIYSVHNLISSIVKKGAIHIASFEVVSKMNTRKYRPLISEDDYALMHATEHFFASKKLEASKLVASLLDSDENEQETIKQLEKMLEERKAKLQNKNQ